MDPIINVSGYKDIASLKQAADHIIEAEEGTTYLGFCKKGIEATNVEGWSILQVRETNHGAYPNEISFKWAKGQCGFNCKMSDYASYDYFYHKF